MKLSSRPGTAAGIETTEYGYDSSAETSEDEIVDETEKRDCDLCNFKGKTEGGLKTHVRRKHKEK